MSIDLRHDSEKGFLIITVTGELSHEEYKAVMNEITQSEQYPADINALWDVREQDFKKVTSTTVKNIIDISRQYPERGSSQVAFVVKDNLAFGMLRMYEMASGAETLDTSQNLRVFRDYTEAEKWLLNEGS